MRIAVASGKGGTGKTTVALALAECAGPDAVLADCDVEEPNCHLFSAAPAADSRPVEVSAPVFGGACDGCGACVRACRFHALARLGRRVLVFPELCHSCGGCVSACPSGALAERPRRIGRIEWRRDPRFRLATGILDVGQTQSPPLIRALKAALPETGTVILDAPPGTACPFVTTVRDCDYAALVTEPTPFGLHDLALAVAVLRALRPGFPCGVILNRAGEGDAAVEAFCRREKIPLLLKIPFSRAVAEGCSAGKSLLSVLPELKRPLREWLAEREAAS